MKDIVIYGAGSVGRLAEQIIADINREQKQYNLLGYLDDDDQKQGSSLNQLPILGGINWLKGNPHTQVVIGFSSPSQKKVLAERLQQNGHHHFATLVHPGTWISKRVEIGEGSMIYPGVHLDVDIRLGKFTLINKLATIGHDTTMGDYVTVSPGVNIGGINQIGEGVEFGINSCSIQHLQIGSWATIGAGAVIIRDVPKGAVMVGNPGKELKRSKKPN